MFEGFEYSHVNTGDANINLVHGGSGPPLLLIHGYPETHVAWHKVAPLLKDSFTLVMPDLRGYGDSSGPEPDPQHQNYSKRAMAHDMVSVMKSLGFDSFAVAGHDRGGRVAYRTALDHPETATQLAVLDIIPTIDYWEHMDFKSALQSSFIWVFMAQPYPLPEKLIGSNPDLFLRQGFASWTDNPGAITPEAMGEYLRSYRKNSVIRASCEDYRAGASVDIELDRQDRDAGRRIQCPVLALWSTQGDEYHSSDPISIWRQWAQDVTGFSLDCGHFLMEEAPEETAEALKKFFQQG